MKSNITPFIDSVLTFLATAVFTAVLSAYFLHDTLTVLAAAVTIATCVTALIKISRSEKSTKSKPEVERLMQALIYGGNDFSAIVYRDALKKRYTVDTADGFIMLNSTAVFTFFKPCKISHTQLAEMYAKAYNKNAGKMTVLSAYGLDKDAESILPRLPHLKIKVLTAEKSYAVLDTLDAVPLNKIALSSPPKKRFKEFLSAALDPDRANGYLFISVVLALTSFIMPYSFYYMLFAILCLVLGVLSKAEIKDRILKYKSKKDKQD